MTRPTDKPVRQETSTTVCTGMTVICMAVAMAAAPMPHMPLTKAATNQARIETNRERSMLFLEI